MLQETRPQPNVLAIVPARGGSKGLPGKNIRNLVGRPLIAWTIAAALSARCISRTIVSTDDDDIRAAALAAGAEVPFRRPDELASDTATAEQVVMHALENLNERFDYVILLQPTSPLREASDIDAAFAQMREKRAHSCVSVCEVDTSPYIMVKLDAEKRVTPLLRAPASLRRQDLPSIYELNGAIYITTPDALFAGAGFVTEGTVGFTMSRDRSVDIDTYADFGSVEIKLNEELYGKA